MCISTYWNRHQNRYRRRLETAGYIRRQRDPHDERALAVTLTDSGNALRERALEIPPAIIDRLGMSLGELQDLHTVLTRVIAAAKPTP